MRKVRKIILTIKGINEEGKIHVDFSKAVMIPIVKDC